MTLLVRSEHSLRLLSPWLYFNKVLRLRLPRQQSDHFCWFDLSAIKALKRPDYSKGGINVNNKMRGLFTTSASILKATDFTYETISHHTEGGGLKLLKWHCSKQNFSDKMGENGTKSIICVVNRLKNSPSDVRF